jgi:glycosyl-4,4'-diaponeurosporenoate acyltransferase
MAALGSTRHVLLAVADAALWAAWSALCGYVAHRLRPDTLARDGVLRIRRFERDGRVYERGLRIKSWKDALPEAGSLFGGGFSKRRLVRHDRAYLERFVVETRRAELTHWGILALSPVFFAWNPWWLALAMLGYGIGANVPCLLVQRYNRCRLTRILGPPVVERPSAGSPPPTTRSS